MTHKNPQAEVEIIKSVALIGKKTAASNHPHSFVPAMHKPAQLTPLPSKTVDPKTLDLSFNLQWIEIIRTVPHLQGCTPQEHISHSWSTTECVKLHFALTTQSVLQWREQKLHTATRLHHQNAIGTEGHIHEIGWRWDFYILILYEKNLCLP